MKIIIFDDHPLTILGIQKELIDHFGKIEIKAFTNIDACTKYIKEKNEIELVISDIRIHDKIRFEIIETCFTEKIKCLVFSGYLNNSFINESLRLKVVGYVGKICGNGELIKSITAIKRNCDLPYLCDYTKSSLLKSKTIENLNIKPNLSSKEKDILDLFLDGFTVSEIAKSMNLSEHSIRAYRKNMLLNNNCNFNFLIKLYLEWK